MKLHNKTVHKGETISRWYSKCVDQHCQGFTLLFRDRPFVRVHRVCRRYAQPVRKPDEDTTRGSRRDSRCEKKRDKGRIRALCNAMFLSSQLSMPELRSEHFTFIRADARETPLVYLSIPA